MSDPGDAEGREVCLVDDDLTVLKSMYGAATAVH